jgi:hypothetical protein
MAADPWYRILSAREVHLREVKPGDPEWSAVTDDLRLTAPADPTVRVGDRVNVRNLAGGFLANNAGVPMSWPVLSISNGRVELAGKQHPDMLGNRWRASVDLCVVDLAARRRDMTNRFANALVEVPGPDDAVVTYLFTEHMPNVVLASLVGEIGKRGIPLEVTSDRPGFRDGQVSQDLGDVAARRRQDRMRQLGEAASSPGSPAPGAQRSLGPRP